METGFILIIVSSLLSFLCSLDNSELSRLLLSANFGFFLEGDSFGFTFFSFSFFILGGFGSPILIFPNVSFVVSFFESVVFRADEFAFLVLACCFSTWSPELQGLFTLDGTICFCDRSCQESDAIPPLAFDELFLFFPSLPLVFFGIDGEGITKDSEIDEDEASTPMIFCK